MAEKKATYPKIVANSWFILRDRAQNSPSAKITPEIVQAMFDMATPASARDNVVSHLRKVGIVDDEGNLTERGNLWRNDDTYAEACRQIIDEFYPHELESLGDQAALERWFSGQGFGASNARAMTRTYRLLAEATIPDELPTISDGTKGSTKAAARRAPAKVPTADPAPPPSTQPQATNGATKPAHSADAPISQPSLQMNLQIHLPPDATAEQIDMIFASMAKHLYGQR